MSAHGSETEVPVPIPSPKGVLSDGSRVQGIHVTATDQTANIRYTLLNDQRKQIDGVLTFYSPLFGWSGEDTTYSDRHFPELTVRSGAKSIHPTTRVNAFHDGIDVTRRLSTLKIDPLRVSLRGDALIPMAQLNRKAVDAAIRDRLLTADDGLLTPNWYVQVSHAFHVQFERPDEKYIDIQYKLRPGFEPLPWSDKRLEALASEHCTTIEQLKAATQETGKPLSDFVVAQTYQIPLGLGNAPLPEQVSVDFLQNSLWSGLSPKASFTCHGDDKEHSIMGSPSFKATISNLRDRMISILVILPQQGN